MHLFKTEYSKHLTFTQTFNKCPYIGYISIAEFVNSARYVKTYIIIRSLALTELIAMLFNRALGKSFKQHV